MSNDKLREFSEWLDTYRDLPVHEVFYEIVLRYEEALATTEPVMANGLTEAETDATASVVGLATTEPEPTGKQSLQVEPAVNQQLTTEPVDEREHFEKWANDNAIRTDLGAWDAWQARAAMAQVSDINVVESFTNDTKDAERYRWLADSNNYYEAINLISDGSLTEDALGKAIDAAMAKGVK